MRNHGVLRQILEMVKAAECGVLSSDIAKAMGYPDRNYASKYLDRIASRGLCLKVVETSEPGGGGKPSVRFFVKEHSEKALALNLQIRMKRAEEVRERDRANKREQRRRRKERGEALTVSEKPFVHVLIKAEDAPPLKTRAVRSVFELGV